MDNVAKLVLDKKKEAAKRRKRSGHLGRKITVRVGKKTRR